MADEKKPEETTPNEASPDTPETTDIPTGIPSDIPEVDAEIINPDASTTSDDETVEELSAEPLDAVEASDGDTDGEHEDAVPADATSEDTSEGGSRSPGMILFFVFMLAAIGIAAVYMLNREDDVVAYNAAPQKAVNASTPKSEDTTAPNLAATKLAATDTHATASQDGSKPTPDAPKNLGTDVKEATQAADQNVADNTPADGDKDETLADEDVATDASIKSIAVAADEKVADAAAQFSADAFSEEAMSAEVAANPVEENITTESEPVENTEAPAGTTPETPTNDVAEINTPIDPRAAIAALQKEAAQREADITPAPEEDETQTAEAEEASTDEIAEATATGETIEADEEPSTDPATAEVASSEVQSALEQASEATDAQLAADTEEAEETVAADTSATMVAADEPEVETETTDNSQTEELAKIANALSEDRTKIIDEISLLKEELRQETNALNAAVSEGRELTEQQSTRITDLRASLEQALIERDKRANAEINSLRAALEKIQSGSEELPAGRRAKASLALLGMQRALDSGAPFANELTVLERIAPDNKGLIGLRKTAEKGAPTLAALKTSFGPALRDALATGNANKPTNGVIARFSKLVSVRPATPQSGESVKAIISRAESNLENDRLEVALEEIKTLEGRAAEAFKPWVNNAQARVNALEAIKTLNEGLLSDVEG